MRLLWMIPLILMTACVKPEPEIRTVTIKAKPIETPTLNLPPVDTYKSRNIDWIIITRDNVEEVFADLEARGVTPVIFGVTSDGYEDVAINTREALRVILQQQAVIDGYETYYIRVNDAINKNK